MTKEKWYNFNAGGVIGWAEFSPNYKERIVDTSDNLKKAVKESDITKEKWYDFNAGGVIGWAEFSPNYSSWKKAAADAVKKAVKKSGTSKGSVQAKRSKSLPKR